MEGEQHEGVLALAHRCNRWPTVVVLDSYLVDCGCLNLFQLISLKKKDFMNAATAMAVVMIYLAQPASFSWDI